MVTRSDEKNFTLTVSRLFGNIGKFVYTFYFAKRVTRYDKNWLNELLLAGQSSNTVGQTNKVCISFSKGFGNVRKTSKIIGNLRSRWDVFENHDKRKISRV